MLRLLATHRFRLSWAGAFAAGAVLRLYRLAPQVLVDDELHAVRAVAGRPFPEILVTYGVTDVCLPLVGLARWLSEHGVLLAEGAFRTPVVVCGLLLLALFPWLARPVSAPVAALLFPWLLALSPQLVLYGRLVRSYTPSALFAGLAAAAFFAWWRTRRPGFAILYASAGALAVWSHLLVAVFVAAPLGFAGLAWLAERVRERRGGPRSGSPGPVALALVALALAAGLACFLVPGWESLSEVLSGKQGRGEIRLDTLTGSAALLAGTAAPVPVVLFWAAVAWGLLTLARRDRALALYSAFLVAVHLAALAVLLPYGIASPLIFARYLVVALPILLLWLAHAFAWYEWSGGAYRGAAGALAGGLLLVLILATGPFTSPRFHHSSFVHHQDFLAFHRPIPTLPEAWMPRFYRRLARRPAGRGALIELPAFPEGQNRALHRYQDLHRREVILATADPRINDPRFAFRNRVPPFPEPVLGSRARYLVVHRDLEAEERAVELPPGAPAAWGDRERNLSDLYRRLAAAFPGRVAAVLGPPDEVYARLMVWDLDRVRRRRALSFRHAPQAPPLLEDRPAPADGPGDLRGGGDPRPGPVRLADLPVALAEGDRAGAAGDPAGGGEHRRPDRRSRGPAG